MFLHFFFFDFIILLLKVYLLFGSYVGSSSDSKQLSFQLVQILRDREFFFVDLYIFGRESFFSESMIVRPNDSVSYIIIVNSCFLEYMVYALRVICMEG